jgi:hypothetical protein
MKCTFEELTSSPNCHNPKVLDVELHKLDLALPAPVPEATFARAVAAALHFQADFDSRQRNPYHNLEHAIMVYTRVNELLRRCDFPQSISQAIRFAAICHDLGHCGLTLRQNWPHAKDGLSNEEFSVYLAESFTSTREFGWSLRILIKGLIIGTTFGNPQGSVA